MVSDTSRVVSQLHELAKNAPTDENSRKQLFEAARSLTFALESPGDSIQRICYLPLQLTMARIGNDLNLFELLAKSGSEFITTDELASKTRADALLLRRVLHYLAAFGMIKEIAEDQFAPSNITKTLAMPGLKAGINHNFNNCLPCYHKLPTYLAERKYQNPTDVEDSAFQPGHNTELTPFVWLMKHPSELNECMQWMTVQHEGQKVWTDVFPFEEELSHNITPETPLFVDIGGGVGHQCVAIRTKFPKLPGRVILQDLQPMVAQAIPAEGVEAMAHDFWTPQPVKGARAYYMRNVMHDYPDSKCREILRLTIAAMSKDSVILIDDMVLPDQDVNWQQAQLDMMVMTIMSAMERTEKQWYALLDSAGLKIKKIYAYTDDLHDSILVAVPK